MKIFLPVAVFLAAAVFAQGESPATSSGDTSERDRLINLRKNDALVEGLKDILARRESFFSELDTLPENECARRAADLAERFDLLLKKFPDSVEVMFFYAEFLRDGGETARAKALLEKALPLAETAKSSALPLAETAKSSALPSVKFLLAELIAGQGNAEEAFPHFRDALFLNPGNAEWYGIFGEFLLENRDRLLEKKAFENRAEIDAAMQEAFLSAAATDDDNFAFYWRYAESFYDVETPDWERALREWGRVVRKMPKAKKAELSPLVALHRARVLAELGRCDEAKEALREAAGVPALERSRQKVFEIIKKNSK